MTEKIGIFSGSFNPVHTGHLILANYISEFTDLDEVWFVVTPHNPLKEAIGLLGDDLRLQMVQMAVEEFDHISFSDVEFHLPRPSYTVDTLTALTDQYPDKDFTLIIGGDNWNQFHKWKEPERLIKNYQILVYPRMNEDVVIPAEFATSVYLVDAPVIELSSTFIRKSIRQGKNMRAFLPPKVYDFIVQYGLYRN